MRFTFLSHLFSRRDVKAARAAAVEQLLFVHIPKTGGVSLCHALGSWAGITDTKRFANDQQLAEFRARQHGSLSNYRFVTGHLSLPELREKGLDAPAVTLTREPISRIVSMYRYLKRSDHPDHAALKWHDPEPFVDWLVDQPFYYNVQCRMISGRPRFDAARRVLEEERLLAAPLERIGALVELLSELVGWRLEISHLNRSSDSDRVELSEVLLARLEPLTNEDRRLHQFVLEAYHRLELRFRNICG